MAVNTKKRTEKACFVIMPFGDERKDPKRYKEFKDVFEHVIKPAAESHGYSVLRADMSDRPAMITPEIVTALFRAPIVIADLSRENPNVYYELGIRHAFKKPVIHICHQEGFPPPFDISWQRIIKYSLGVAEATQTKDAIAREIAHLEKNPEDFDNPVKLAAAVLTLESTDKSLGVIARFISLYASTPGPANIQVSSGYPAPRETVRATDGAEYGVDKNGRLVKLSGYTFSILDEPTPLQIHTDTHGNKYGVTRDGHLVELLR